MAQTELHITLKKRFWVDPCIKALIAIARTAALLIVKFGMYPVAKEVPVVKFAVNTDGLAGLAELPDVFRKMEALGERKKQAQAQQSSGSTLIQ